MIWNRTAIEQQSSLKDFSVRQDVFEAYIDKQFENWEKISKAYRTNTISLERWTEPPKVSGEDKEFLRFMVENAYWDNTFDEIYWDIIAEEAGGFWAGDKTAEEAAGIIQNRVQLYLDEM